jgi:hypothetical protein
VQKLVQAVVVTAACVMTAWWLLSGSRQQAPILVPMSDELETRATKSRVDAARGAVVRDGEPAPGVSSRVAAAGEGLRAVAPTGVGAAVEPIPLIEGITLPGGMWNLHTMMERELRDAAWADDMERRFATYFASKPELGQNFSQPSILCRSRFCEIQAVGYGPRAFDTWKTATADLRDQPWASSMRGGGIYTIERAPNEQAVVLILMRPWIIQRDDRVDMRLTPPASK